MMQTALRLQKHEPVQCQQFAVLGMTSRRIVEQLPRNFPMTFIAGHPNGVPAQRQIAGIAPDVFQEPRKLWRYG